MTTPPGAVQFLVVGSPRSGTTLVQRLACEIPGVRMPPETHFFTRYGLALTRQHRFPLTGDSLTDAVSAFAAIARADGVEVDVDAVVADLGGSCARPLALFEAVVRQLAGPAEVWGEKTPGHLVWWRPISAAAPWMRIVAVVRDPRAVVASNLDMPWRTDRSLPAWGDDMHLAFAQLWSFLQGQVERLSQTLGPDRCLVLRYEDVAADPDSTRSRMAAFLGRPAGFAPQDAPAGIVLPWESWKTQALGPVADDRIDAWREKLAPRQAADIALVCRRMMPRFGYTDDVPSPSTALAHWARFGPVRVARLARYGRGRRRHLRTVERTLL